MLSFANLGPLPSDQGCLIPESFLAAISLVALPQSSPELMVPVSSMPPYSPRIIGPFRTNSDFHIFDILQSIVPFP